MLKNSVSQKKLFNSVYIPIVNQYLGHIMRNNTKDEYTYGCACVHRQCRLVQ